MIQRGSMSLFDDHAHVPTVPIAREHPELWPPIYPLGHQHEKELQRVLLGLDATARRHRFGQAASDAYLADYARRALANAAWIGGAFIDGRLRGVVEVYDCGGSGCAEAAFVVEHNWRRRGLGWALLREALRTAAESKMRTLRMIFSRQNWPMRRLATRAGGTVDIVLDELLVDVALVSRF
jgi:GNAT superfamily N-acetyltransferase